MSPNEITALWELEEQFWTGGLDHARATTAKNAVMVFPYPVGILQGDKIWSRLDQRTSWRSIKMIDRRATIDGALAVLAYLVAAEKADLPIHMALCASTYLHDDGKWMRMSHQQTSVT